MVYTPSYQERMYFNPGEGILNPRNGVLIWVRVYNLGDCEVRWPEFEVFRHPNNATYTPLKIEIKIFSTKI